jgi:hypothetical protein
VKEGYLMKKIIWPGFVAGIVILILSMSISYLFMAIPSVKADYYNPAIMRQMQDPVMTLFFLYPFIAGIIYSWAWDKSKTLFAGSLWRRGAVLDLPFFLSRRFQACSSHMSVCHTHS